MNDNLWNEYSGMYRRWKWCSIRLELRTWPEIIETKATFKMKEPSETHALRKDRTGVDGKG